VHVDVVQAVTHVCNAPHSESAVHAARVSQQCASWQATHGSEFEDGVQDCASTPALHALQVDPTALS
jgi:hypothetical protein